ncbi:MAG: PEP-CTERM sorting domain-containing protein [Methylomonas sp.]
MKSFNHNSFRLAAVSVLAMGALAGLAPNTASAALVTGTATITIDNDAFKASNGYGVYLEKHWGPSDNALDITRNTSGGTTINVNGSTAMLFPVNSNITTLDLTAPCTTCTPKSYGRILQATTMDAGNTSAGQIGLSGGWRLNSPYGVLTPYDFSLSKVAGTWAISTYDSAYKSQEFLKLTHVSEALSANGELLLSGDLQWSGAIWPMMAGADTSVVVGSFSLMPAAVPVPAAVWMFGTGLVGLLGINRRRSAKSALQA